MTMNQKERKTWFSATKFLFGICLRGSRHVLSHEIVRIIAAKDQPLRLESLPTCFQFGGLILLIEQKHTRPPLGQVSGKHRSVTSIGKALPGVVFSHFV